MVHKDERLFDGLRRLLRKIIAIDMEAAAIGEVAHQNGMPFLVVKSVVDFADLQKSDHFRTYSALVAATFLTDLCLERRANLRILRRS